MLAVKVSVLAVVAGLGLKEAETPLGRPEADMVTELENPLSGATVTVAPPCLLRPMVKLAGEADNPKSGLAVEALTVRVTEVV